MAPRFTPDQRAEAQRTIVDVLTALDGPCSGGYLKSQVAKAMGLDANGFWLVYKAAMNREVARAVAAGAIHAQGHGQARTYETHASHERRLETFRQNGLRAAAAQEKFERIAEVADKAGFPIHLTGPVTCRMVSLTLDDAATLFTHLTGEEIP